MTEAIQPYNPQAMVTSLDGFSDGLTAYLTYLGLPTDAVLVDNAQRQRAINNLPETVALLDGQQRQAAMYLSKFVAACATGLFDSALNYLWNETIRNLRHKVGRFDLEYFYGSVIQDDKQRPNFQGEDDLPKLDDWQFVQGCKKTGIISQTGYTHLDYIRNMRNHASAAHPNHNELTGLQLVTWLETCIREVLARNPEEPAITAQRLLQNLRVETLSPENIPPIAEAIPRLPGDVVQSLLRAIFGMYTDPNINATIRNNIRLVAPEVWNTCTDDARFEIGLKEARFSTNAEVTRGQLAREFLERVDGLAYLSRNILALEVSNVLDALYLAHGSWDNFYHEGPHARNLQALIPANGEIDTGIIQKYVKVLTLCRIGNGYGVSWNGRLIYDDLIGRWQNQHVMLFVRLIENNEIASRLSLGQCGDNYQHLAGQLDAQVTNRQLRAVLEFVRDFPTDRLESIKDDRRYQQMIQDVHV